NELRNTCQQTDATKTTFLGGICTTGSSCSPPDEHEALTLSIWHEATYVSDATRRVHDSRPNSFGGWRSHPPCVRQPCNKSAQSSRLSAHKDIQQLRLHTSLQRGRASWPIPLCVSKSWNES